MKLGHGLGLATYRKTGEAPILDQFAGAAAAFSLRYISSSFSSDVVLVRRSSDNAELGFTPTEITDGTLTSWVGGNNDGFVKTWYDQSSNANNAIQANTALQSLIVSAGNLITVGGLPGIKVIDPGEYYSISSITPVTTFTVGKIDVINGANYFAWSSAGGDFGMFYGGTATGTMTGLGVFDGATKSITGEDTNRHLGYFFYNGANYEVAKDGGSAISLSAGVNRSIEEFLGRSFAGLNLSFQGVFQEAIFWDSNQSANKAAIETAINSYYSIY